MLIANFEVVPSCTASVTGPKVINVDDPPLEPR